MLLDTSDVVMVVGNCKLITTYCVIVIVIVIVILGLCVVGNGNSFCCNWATTITVFDSLPAYIFTKAGSVKKNF